MKTARKHKVAYRFSDLDCGDNFRIDSYPYDTLTAAESFCGGWRGNSQVQLNQNCQVDPVNRRKAALNRRRRLSETCKRFGVSVSEVREAYRQALASKPYTDHDGSKMTAIVNAIPEQIREALAYFGLGLIFGYVNRDGDNRQAVAGEYPRRMYI